jgi:hypothetical protein
MASDQELLEKRERIAALRAQIRAEQSDRAVEQAEMARDAKFEALSEEERMLEAQLTEIRSIRRPGEADVEVTVPVLPEEGSVNLTGGPVRADQDPLAEGVPFTETVDSHGNLVRTPVNLPEDASVELSPAGEASTTTPEGDPVDLGTREADPPPPDVPDDANLGRSKRR